VPHARASEKAVALLSALVGDRALVDTVESEYPWFVSPGNRVASVFCNSCGARIESSWWDSAMNHAWTSRHAELRVRVPCCGRQTSLNDLRYEPSAGFARFILEASNSPPPGADVMRQLEEALGCSLKAVCS